MRHRTRLPRAAPSSYSVVDRELTVPGGDELYHVVLRSERGAVKRAVTFAILVSAAVLTRGEPIPRFGQLELCGTSSQCEQGHFYMDGLKFPWPSGTFGSSAEETNFLCSRTYPAGYYCPKGGTSPVACGNSSVFCAAGSARPVSVAHEHYTIGGTSPTSRHDEAICPTGYYCEDGVKSMCPAGAFGEARGVTGPTCSGRCPAGWYCPAGSANSFALPCGGPDLFCPEESRRPLPVDSGFFAGGRNIDRRGEQGGYSMQARCPIGRWCKEGVSFPCPPGRYGSTQASKNSSCTGPCREGHFCPKGSYRADQYVCGKASVYCPEGASSPTKVAEGFYTVRGAVGQETRHPGSGVASTRTAQVLCEPGFYCAEGLRRPCPPGTYGNASGLSKPSCSGPCSAGYICEEGAMTSTQAVCGGDGELFCPLGSSTPTTVQEGYYTYTILGETKHVTVETDRKHFQADTRSTSTTSVITTTSTAEALCEPGYWCRAGLRYPCDAGFYGDAFGETRRRTCSGPCKPGFICGTGSVSPEQRPCGDPSGYCPGGSWEAVPVSGGYFSVGGSGANTRTGQELVGPGSYANHGQAFACPAGHYGASHGLSSPRCSGTCSPGFYCPTASVSRRERACGGASLICPAGSGRPIRIEDGYYTTDYSSFPDNEECPPGTYRNASNLLSADPTRGEPSAISTGVPLAPCQSCPEGTFKANSGDGLALCVPCDEQTAESIEARTSCVCRRINGGDVTAQFLYFNTTSAECQNVTRDFRPPAESIIVETVFTRYSALECEPGHYCIAGVRLPCPAGRFGAKARENRSECTGECEPGWYCPEASVSATQVPCGAANLYCPRGSAAPIFVEKGFYSLGVYKPASDEHNSKNNRGYGYETSAKNSFNAVIDRFINSSASIGGYSVEAAMPNGTRGAAFRSDVAMCPMGWFCPGDGGGSPCPPGTYGKEMGLRDPKCSGRCAAGHFCPAGSPSPFTRKCGGVGLYCPAGSWEPQQVLQGYYGLHAGPEADLKAAKDPLNQTYSAQVLCEPGYFCHGGIKEPCPEGTFLWEFGESSRASCVPCKAGYFCGGEPHEGPSVTASPNECGTPEVFCPRGSAAPVPVSVGYYSVGGGADGKTRVSQVLCEPGTYCKAGSKARCPQGTYGSSAGLHDPSCDGLCPPGCACPEGTADPVPCDEGFYAVGGAVACSACPGRRATRESAIGGGVERCRTSRSCCT